MSLIRADNPKLTVTQGGEVVCEVQVGLLSRPDPPRREMADPVRTRFRVRMESMSPIPLGAAEAPVNTSASILGPGELRTNEPLPHQHLRAIGVEPEEDDI